MVRPRRCNAVAFGMIDTRMTRDAGDDDAPMDVGASEKVAQGLPKHVADAWRDPKMLKMAVPLGRVGARAASNLSARRRPFRRRRTARASPSFQRRRRSEPAAATTRVVRGRGAAAATTRVVRGRGAAAAARWIVRGRGAAAAATRIVRGDESRRGGEL